MSTAREVNPPEKPLFRYDLETVQVQESGHRFVDVTDPDTGTRFRFYEVEYAVACGLDGSRDVAGLAAWALDELGLDASNEELEQVIGKLASLGYLAGQADAAAQEAEAHRIAQVAARKQAAATIPTPAEPPEPQQLPPTPRAPQPASPEPMAARGDGDIALGHAGKSPLQRERPPVQSGAEIELGFAGAQPAGDSAAPPARAKGPDLDLGHAGASSSEELSVDLSAHLDIGTDDVKEAVRQSKVMQAVTVPEDLETEILAPEAPEPKKPSAEPVVLPEKPPEAAKPATDRDEIAARAAEQAARAAEKAAASKAAKEPAKAAEAPEAEAAVATEAAGEETQTRSVRRSLLLVLLLAVVGVGAWYYYQHYIKEKPPEPRPRPTPGQAANPAVPTQPGAPAPTAAIEAGEAPTTEAVAAQAGQVSWLEEAGAEVTAGAVVAKLAGHQRWEAEVARAKESQARYQRKLDAATANDDKPAMAKNQADVDRKQGDIDKAEEKLAPYLVVAGVDGVVEPLVEVNSRVEAEQPVVRIAGEALPVARFELPAGTSMATGARVEVVSATDGEVRAACTIIAVEGQSVTAECPVDSGLPVGSQVQLVLP